MAQGEYRDYNDSHYTDELDELHVIQVSLPTVRRIPEEVAMLDRSKRNSWQTGEFVWAPIWQLAYPFDRYRWL